MSNATQTANQTANQTATLPPEVLAMMASMKSALEAANAKIAKLELEGTKPAPKIPVKEVTLATLTKAVQELTGQSPKEKTFGTGSVGFYNSFKIKIDGAMYQCSLQLVKCGSKPKE